MILFERHDNILESPMDALVCPVNTVFTMGKGLALQFKERWPHLDHSHKAACRQGVFQDQGFYVAPVAPDKKVVFIATKRHWRNPSRLEWVDHGLMKLAENYSAYGIQSLAIPALGCGEGQLQWRDVRPLILEHFGQHNPLGVAIYCPAGCEPK